MTTSPLPELPQPTLQVPAQASARPTAPTLPDSPYPYAAAPDIIRARQKDAYFQGQLAADLSDLHRRALGARSAHAWAAETRTAADLLYLGLTTLVGSRTLGEEYCDVVQVEPAKGGQLPGLRRRTAYIAGSVLVPYALARVLPTWRSRVRALLERRLATLKAQGRARSRESKLWAYVAEHLGAITGGAGVQAVTLALFYFSGTYYELTKRLLGLRYVFTRSVPQTPDRAGYEVLGALLVVQMAVQGYLHVRDTIAAAAHADRQHEETEAALRLAREDRVVHPHGDITLSDTAFASNTALLVPDLGGVPVPHASHIDLAAATHTPVLAPGAARVALQDETLLRFIKGDQQRRCTLCLDELRDPAATPCGHVFCWACIGDWVREKPECPLCRRDALPQHVLPLR